ncbi:DNA-binding protein smubp-2 [Phtheirospermum japonicum]|uniref:DNA-binding protein smubp-2 n=1 Tax=Phtheirospermum japonicum TaxID=374723 RepID=A0A830CII5_9LAMI|nr:DNA-binding protein smubp-2 [Phtheirospermum japonicum]
MNTTAVLESPATISFTEYLSTTISTVNPPPPPLPGLGIHGIEETQTGLGYRQLLHGEAVASSMALNSKLLKAKNRNTKGDLRKELKTIQRRKLDVFSFDLVIIDEAAQALEIARWICSFEVPPTIQSVQSVEAEKKGLGRTLFERLADLYGDDVISMLTVQYHHTLYELEDVKKSPWSEPTLLIVDTAGVWVGVGVGMGMGRRLAEHLTNIVKHNGGKVQYGGGAHGQIIGKGTLNVEGLPKLQNVLLVKGLAANLISISQL